MSKRHIQVPVMEINKSLLFSDPYVYACIKKYMNKDTKEAFPSMSTLINDSGLNKKTIIAAIERLEKNNYISVQRKTGASNIYKFNEYTTFEIFSYDFLELKTLSPKAKAYMVILQHDMRMNQDKQTGTIEYNQIQLAEKLGLSLPTFRKIEKELEQHGTLIYTPTNKLELIKTDRGDIIPATGLRNCKRIYDLNSIMNTVALQFIKHEQKIENVDEKAEIATGKAEYAIDVAEEANNNYQQVQEKMQEMQEQICDLTDQVKILKMENEKLKEKERKKNEVLV